MKPSELYHTWSQFEAMMENPTLSDEKKIAIGGEWVRSLPPKLLCASSQLSYEIVFQAMNGRLNDLKEKQNGSSTTTPKEEKGQEPTQLQTPARTKSVRSDATNRRGKKTMEDLDGS